MLRRERLISLRNDCGKNKMIILEILRYEIFIYIFFSDVIFELLQSILYACVHFYYSTN